ncbi:unnamed protein product, partial [Didymodactylos carnosus]
MRRAFVHGVNGVAVAKHSVLQGGVEAGAPTRAVPAAHAAIQATKLSGPAVTDEMQYNNDMNK